MGLLCVPKASRRMQRTLKNLRVSLLCFLLTFLVLRNTIGAGKFGTPAQDFEEIRQHLHHVGLHRRHFRVLAEAVEEEDKQRGSPWLEGEPKQRRSPFLKEEVNQRRSPLPEKELKQRRSPLLEEDSKQINAPLLPFKEMQGNAALLAVDLKHREAPLHTPSLLEGSHKGVLEGNAGFQKDLELSRVSSWNVQRKIKETLAHSSYGALRVLVVTELPSSGCKNPAGEHFLLKSLKNKVDYSTLHGLEISLSFGSIDPHIDGPVSKLSLLQSSMAKYRHVEWLWWVPSGALITDMAFELPMENYTEFNLILIGSDGPTPRQEIVINLNTDTFLIRNCQWSLDLLRKCSSMGSAEGRHMESMNRLLQNSLIKRSHLQAGDHYASIFFSSQEKKIWEDKIHVGNPVVLRVDWRDTVPKFESIVKQSQRETGDKKLPFVTHFLGCNLCHEVDGGKEGGLCEKQMERALVFAEKQVMQNDGMQHKSFKSA
eukprot:c24173_g1_i1 orf=563-2017(-)